MLSSVLGECQPGRPHLTAEAVSALQFASQTNLRTNTTMSLLWLGAAVRAALLCLGNFQDTHLQASWALKQRPGQRRCGVWIGRWPIGATVCPPPPSPLPALPPPASLPSTCFPIPPQPPLS